MLETSGELALPHFMYLLALTWYTAMACFQFGQLLFMRAGDDS